MNQKIYYFLFLFLCFTRFLNAQQQNDSLAKYSYEELGKKFYHTRFTNKESCKIYAEEYLLKAKLDGDKIKISRGYYQMAIFYYVVSNRDLKSIKYTDSIIEVCKDCTDKIFPAEGYYAKGAYLYDLGRNKEALASFLNAIKVLEKNKNISLEIDVRGAIISVKSNWNSNNEMLNFTLDNYKFIMDQEDYKVNFNYEYVLSIGNLIIQYGKNKKYKKMLELSRKAIDEGLESKRFNYYDFVSLAGIAQYYLENSEITIDSLQKALPHRNDHGKAMNNYYLAKSYDKLKQPEKAHFHFLKTDSIYQVTKDVFPEMRNVYEHIIDYYKSKNDAENQIKYYDRLIETDKIIDSTYTYVNDTIEKKYETPQAIAERNRLLEEAKAKESSWKYSFGIISVILLLISGVLFYVFRRQKYYKKRFENLMSNNSDDVKDIPTALHVTKEKDTSTPLSVKKDIGISKTIVKSILKGLSKFEASEDFRKQVTLTELAKTLETNPKYLSKVINWHYQKNFSSYVNELRVEYVVSKLKSDSKFRNYTIKAIAKEAGFGSAESFSKTFYKSTGIYPSYFIKELNKRQNS